MFQDFKSWSLNNRIFTHLHDKFWCNKRKNVLSLSRLLVHPAAPQEMTVSEKKGIFTCLLCDIIAKDPQFQLFWVKQERRPLAIRHYPHALWHGHVKVNVHIYRPVYFLLTRPHVTKVHLTCFGSSSATLKLFQASCSGHQRRGVKSWAHTEK